MSYANPLDLSVPIQEKYALTVQETAVLTNIGEKRLRRLLDQCPDASFVLRIGSKTLFKRERFLEFLDQRSSV